MYNPQVQYQQPGMPMPQGGAMPVTQGMGAPAPGGSMPSAAGMGGMGMPAPQGGQGMGQLDPAMVQQILALQQQQGRRAAVQRQLGLANQLRADAGDQLQGFRGQKYYTPPGVANLGASLLSSYAAKRQMDDANAKDSALDADRSKAAGSYFDLIRGLRGAGGPAM